MGELPAPLTTADDDVSALDGFKLNVERLMVSELIIVASPEECWAALMLWCRAWKQTPAGSVPDDDRLLAAFSGAGRRWLKVKANALHGFIKCSDGRLYHPFLCAEVKRAALSRKAFQDRRERDRNRLRNWRGNTRETHDETDDETRFVRGREGKGRESRLPSRDSPRPKAKPENQNPDLTNLIHSSVRAGARLNGHEPPVDAPNGDWLKRRKHDLLLQKLIRFANATMPNSATAIEGLMSDNTAEAQRWYDTLDGQMRSAGWNDGLEKSA